MNEKQYCGCDSCRDLCDRDSHPNYQCHHCNEKWKRLDDGNINSIFNTNTFNPIFNPSITINLSPGSTPTLIGVETVQYITLAEEGKKIYTNENALKQYGSSDILDPNTVSTINLFVNGVLQPPSIYNVEEGILRLESSDLPPRDAPIIVLFVTVKG